MARRLYPAAAGMTWATSCNLIRREFLTAAGVWKAKDPRSGLSDWLDPYRKPVTI